MNEARGLADILRNKYFGVPIYADILLEKNIVETDFSLPSDNFTMLGIKINKNEKITMYTVMSRLGFNDKERNDFLSEYFDMLQGNSLFNVFKEILDSVEDKKNSLSEEDKVFYNKISFYVEYCNRKIDYLARAKLQEDINILMEELGRLLNIKDNLEKQIDIIKHDVSVLEEGIRGIKL